VRAEAGRRVWPSFVEAILAGLVRDEVRARTKGRRRGRRDCPAPAAQALRRAYRAAAAARMPWRNCAASQASCRLIRTRSEPLTSLIDRFKLPRRRRG